ncbi:MAG TPA: YfcE family phosphodiesterase [Myxococcota bacterium]|nr:YfcE family phosphodiesterase [Myxococcota bacterium]
MRVGVISDTHDQARNVARIVELLRGARVERVIHTGDITRPATLRLLGGIGVPVFGVFGNNDAHHRAELAEAAAELGFELAEPPLVLGWAGRRITVVHDRRAHPELEPGDVLLHGHDHRLCLERVDGTLVFNPGECAGWLEGRNAVGLLDLARLEAEVLRF